MSSAAPRHAEPDAQTIWRASWPIDVVRVLDPLRRGSPDPCHAVVGGCVVWMVARMTGGGVTARIEQVGERDVSCRAWGPGAVEFVDGLPALLGAGDDCDAFEHLDHALVRKLHLAHPWLRIPCSGRVFEALTGAIFEQRVLVEEAFAARRWLLRRYGELPPAAPGMPEGMRIVPAPDVWRSIPSWDFHRSGCDVHRAATLLRCAQVAKRLDEIPAMEREAGVQRLRAVRGVGVWTAAEVRQRALGDPDAVSYGDTHLARFVGYALTGDEVDDHGMEQLLAPWHGQRFRVIRLLQLGVAHGVIRTAPRIARPRPRQHLRF